MVATICRTSSFCYLIIYGVRVICDHLAFVIKIWTKNFQSIDMVKGLDVADIDRKHRREKT